MRGLASPSPQERANTPASVVSSSFTSDSAPSPSLRSRSRTISTTTPKSVNGFSPSQPSTSQSHSTLPPTAPSFPAGSVSARAAHFNALARGATASTPSPMKGKGRREPGFARPTRSSSAKIAKSAVPILDVLTNSTPAASVGASHAGSTAPPTPCTPATTAPPSPNPTHAAPTESEPSREPEPEAALPGLRPLLLPTGSAAERFNLAPQSTVRTRLSLVTYKVDKAADEVHPLPASHPASPARFNHHRRHSSLIYKKTEPSTAFPISPSSTSSELHPSDPEGFLEGCRSDPGFRDRRQDSIVSGNLERRESILRSIVRVENREREVREAMERRGYEPASGPLRRLSLQGRPARLRSTPCMPSHSPIEGSPISLMSPYKLEPSPAAPPSELESPQMDSPQLGAEELLSVLEPQVTRETDISTAPTTLGLTGAGSRSSLLRPASMSTTTTDEEPRVRFATPDDMRAQFRRQIHRESTLAQLTGPQRSRPPVEILDHDHLATMLSKQEYAATVTPATSTTTSIASAESLPRYRRRAEPDAVPNYVASAYTGDATAGIEASSGFGHGGEEAPGATATAPGPTRRTFCGTGGAELDKLVHDVHDEHRFIAVGDVDPLDHLLPEPQEGPSLFTALGRWFCPVDGS
ncbi:hypothetical protein CspHIS471_0109260 [Cutaneotrichosporon sp. HIS471]|nr:hypothetical protein CspHIS471_0109260 [Cutaneotrichosporon sp. HIS471]